MVDKTELKPSEKEMAKHEFAMPLYLDQIKDSKKGYLTKAQRIQRGIHISRLINYFGIEEKGK